ncbi:hypothetical protein ColTof4_09881 [Colletotrichum tofieldiae]|nr:hypothetical protein ColTof3_05240 [Colletotrichum tofieldiae]GKT77458.1 hypothetical protein ColTof4_09881 [Colletotrichum tofieldiae]
MPVDWDDIDEGHLDLVEKMKAAGWPGDGEGGGWDRAKFEKEIFRLLPADENEKAGTMWRRFCATYDEYKTKTNGLEMVPEPPLTKAYITSVGVKVLNAVFEIKHWDHTKITSFRDDGLWDNPRWPSALLPNDSGFVLLTDDRWYVNNVNAQASTALYNVPLPQALTQGMTKSRAIYGRPLIAVRSVDGLEKIDGPSPDLEAYEVPVAKYGELFVKREAFMDGMASKTRRY